jgi:hypothetical protein
MTYPTSATDRALRLVGDADGITEDVARLLGATRIPRITVDLAETSGHHEGISAGARIRMGLVGQDDERRLRHVLAHETTHVYQTQESDRRLVEQGNATRFFVEGSAEWVAREVVVDPETRRASRVVAAASWERHRLELEDVIDDGQMRARWDTTLVYSLGETWTEGIARACGREAVGGVLRALGREGAPEGLAPIALWEDALQHVGCNEAAVRRAWEALLAEIASEERAAIDAIPRAGAAVTREGGATIVVAALDRDSPEGARWSVRVRRDRASSDTEMRSFDGEVEDARRVRFQVPTSLTEPRFELQLCVVPPGGGNWPYCEGWQSG